MAPALAIIMGIDLRIRGAEELLIHGVADEVAHLLTALLMLSAIRAIGFRVSWVAVAIGAVAPDTEYLLSRLDVIDSLEAVAPDIAYLLSRLDMLATIGDGFRGVMHTLVPGAGILLLGLIMPPLRVFLVSLGLALLTHAVRDAATSSVPALWPLSVEYVHLRYAFFLAMLAACATVTSGVVALHYRTTDPSGTG